MLSANISTSVSVRRLLYTQKLQIPQIQLIPFTDLGLQRPKDRRWSDTVNTSSLNNRAYIKVQRPEIQNVNMLSWLNQGDSIPKYINYFAKSHWKHSVTWNNIYQNTSCQLSDYSLQRVNDKRSKDLIQYIIW